MSAWRSNGMGLMPPSSEFAGVGACDEAVGVFGLDLVGQFAGEAEDDGAVGAVALAGPGERAQEYGLDARDAAETGRYAKGIDEGGRGAHGADRM